MLIIIISILHMIVNILKLFTIVRMKCVSRGKMMRILTVLKMMTVTQVINLYQKLGNDQYA